MRDERRRRVLIDETVTGGEEQPTAAAAPTPSKASAKPSVYAPAALAPERHRLLNLVPLRAWTIWVLTLSGLAAIAGILSLHASVFHEPRVVLDRQAIRALDVMADGSLAGWFASLLLTLAAVSSLLLYALRRHRTDDYRGYYRIWLWASAGLWWASIDAATGIHAGLGAALQLLAGTPHDGDGTVWWLSLYGLVFGGLAVRMLLEIRHCRLAVVSLLSAGTLYGSLIAVTLGVLPLDGALLDQLLRGTLELLAHGSVLLAVVLFTRHVVLEAQGKLPARQPRAARPKKPRPARGPKGPASAEGENAPAGATKGKRRAATTRVDSAHDDAPSRPRSRSDVETAARPSPAAGPLAARTAARNADKADTRSPAAASSPSSSRAASGVVASGVQHASRPQNDDSDDDDAGDDSPQGGLSKAERRRLRKMKRRQQPDSDD